MKTVAASEQWAWLFPLTYLVHIGDEYASGEGFPSWIEETLGAQLAPAEFLWLNVAALVLMTSGVLLATRRRSHRWVIPCLSVIVAVNALLHIAGSVAFRSLSPGTISAAALWLPLGLWMLRREARARSRRAFGGGAVTGLFISFLICWLTLTV
ncbi:MAG: hypothetical protein C4334_00170 [Pyrinomonas sp.]|uniref:HXXEE domain-containing protein n=1 Tax=Pyrinomonas sp. TaxID=2080306 RepID=UPI00332146A5